MPDFGLSPEQKEALVVLLTGLKEETLPEKYVAQLSAEQKVIVEGRERIGKYNCSGCHQFDLDKIYLSDGAELSGMIKIQEDEGVHFQLMEDNESHGYKAGEVVFIAEEDIARQEKAADS